MTLVRIAKDWAWPDLLRQTPGGKGIWDGIRFTTDDVDECDALVVLNNRMKQAVHAHCPKGRVWALMQEPYVKGFTDWMAEGHDAFDRIYTNYIPTSDPKYITSQPALPWHVNRTFDELTTMGIPDKTRPLSWIVGNSRELPGHLDRLDFLSLLQREQSIPADLFGRAVRPIDDKWDGLAPYQFSLAIENTVATDYWTEKLADCFLSWTIPIYHGCPNLADYFPADSFISIDVRKPDEALAAIRKVVAGGMPEWKRRLPALLEARHLVLYKYQIFPHLAELLRMNTNSETQKFSVVVPPYQRSLQTRIWRLTGKLKKTIGLRK